MMKLNSVNTQEACRHNVIRQNPHIYIPSLQQKYKYLHLLHITRKYQIDMSHRV